MQQPSKYLITVGIFLKMLGLCLVLAPIGCSNGPESGDSQGSGWFGYAALGEGPHPPPDLGLLDTQGLYDAGAEGTLSYDFATHTFTGRVENPTTTTLRQVRVAVHLSNGIKLGPTASVNLAPGQAVDITIPAGGQPFTHWSAYLGVG